MADKMSEGAHAVMEVTWVTAARIHLECIKHGEHRQTKINAEKEIMQLAKNHDDLIKAYKALKGDS